jgi:hypothetical protein
MSEAVTVHYEGTDVAVRDDLRATHIEMLEYLRRPGAWFSGAERLAIARESRNAANCAHCAAQKAALSPEQPEGQHNRVAELPDALVALCHRLRADPARLSKAWFDSTIASGLDEGPYVEAVGIVAFVAGIDAFCRSLGVPAFALPDPISGEPSRYRPDNLRKEAAWVHMLAPEEVGPNEADLYESAPLQPNIMRALSVVPDHVRMLQYESQSHYVPIASLSDMTIGRSLGRMQIELVAARVSALNECFY